MDHQNSNTILSIHDQESFHSGNSNMNDDGSIPAAVGSFFSTLLEATIVNPPRQLQYYFWNNFTADNNATDFDEQNLVKAQDVTVDAVVTSLYFNALAFVLLMVFYECLRRMLPAVYSSRKRLQFAREGRNSSSTRKQQQQQQQEAQERPASDLKEEEGQGEEGDLNASLSEASLPDDRPLDWIGPVFGVPWNQVRKTAGLDGYFFLRFIRMNVRIAAVSSFWFFVVLVPVYATGSDPNSSAVGWYHLSAANVPAHGWRIWVSVLFMYLFSGFILFVVKQEYRHFLELRQDFLARGTIHVHPQHHYSLVVENIPYALRSNRALADYFERLFPGSVHSASVVLKLPDLEEASARCLRSCRRLEKSIAYLHATHQRPTHTVGRGRLSVLGVDWAPFECHRPSCGGRDSWFEDDDEVAAAEQQAYAEMSAGAAPPIPSAILAHQPRPAKGTRVDSIQYYTQELAAHSRALFRMQQHKGAIAESGNHSIRAEHWFDHVVREANIVAAQIMDESAIDNALMSPTQSYSDRYRAGPHDLAETMSSSNYGSIGQSMLPTPPTPPHRNTSNSNSNEERATVEDAFPRQHRKRITDGDRVVVEDTFPAKQKKRLMDDDDSVFVTDSEDEMSQPVNYTAPFSRDQYTGVIRRFAGRLGLDFVVSIFRHISKQLSSTLENVVGQTMSSTGLVTFLDLASTTCAASAPLTVKASVLDVSVAPEPREIIWKNAHVSKKILIRRESITNILLFLGAILWSFPLAAIQAFSKAENIAQIPGMEWILTMHGGKYTNFINGYLPVVALLVLILILPVIFEFVAVNYERRKTYSDVQASMLGRYFYYQLANIYVSVTAGSIIKSLADIIDKPTHILELLGQSLPTMVGYFIALLVTKILAGLPMVFLRFGALTRMLFLRIFTDEKKLTQRELDAVYRLENVQYGWEFPTQLLVAVIVFTYAVICPVILPFGLLYFMGALTVYKKQILYVYSPVYESGGAMFPLAVQRCLFGLVCSQMTFLGYTITRVCYYPPLALFPLPFMTVAASRYLQRTYAEPSQRLSLERARECDKLSSIEQERRSSLASPVQSASSHGDASGMNSVAGKKSGSFDHGVEIRRIKFDKNSYRQPVLTEVATEPWTYRRGLPDDSETVAVREQLRQINRMVMAYADAEQRRVDNLPAPV